MSSYCTVRLHPSPLIHLEETTCEEAVRQRCFWFTFLYVSFVHQLTFSFFLKKKRKKKKELGTLFPLRWHKRGNAVCMMMAGRVYIGIVSGACLELPEYDDGGWIAMAWYVWCAN